MTNERFCELENVYTGEKINNIRQLIYVKFTGEELKEYVEFFIEQEVSGYVAKGLKSSLK